MNTTNEVSFRQCLESSQEVLLAGQQLHSLLDDDFETIEFAVEQLEKAAQNYDAQETEYRRFMFSQIETEMKTFKQLKKTTTESVIVAALTDLQIGNVMIAAGRVKGELGTPIDRSHLSSSLYNLETTTQFVEHALSNSVSKSFEILTFPLTQSEIKVSLSIKTFKNSVQKTLDSFVSEAEKVVGGVCEELSKLELDSKTISSTISKLGKAIQDLPHIGRLFGQGIRKLKQGLEFLNQILPEKFIKELQNKVGELWKKVEQGEIIHQILSNTFAIESVRCEVFEILETTVNNDGLDNNKLDQVHQALIALAKSFKTEMTMAQNLTKAVTTAGVILSLTPLAGESIILLVPTIYLSIIAVVMLVGMDYTDTRLDIGFVRGVRQISQGLLA